MNSSRKEIITEQLDDDFGVEEHEIELIEGMQEIIKVPTNKIFDMHS